jgi:hypothetical protein
MRVLHSYILSQNGYGWRLKDVAQRTYVELNTHSLQFYGLDQLFLRSQAQDPSTVEEILVRWLGDATRLGGGEGTVGSWTLNLLFCLRRQYEIPSLVRLVLATAEVPAITSLAQALNVGDAALAALAGVRRYLDEGGDAGVALEFLETMELGGVQYADFPGAEFEQLLRGLLARSPDAHQLMRLVRMLAYSPLGLDDAWHLYLEALDAGSASLWPMGRFLEEQPDEAFELLRARWRDLGDWRSAVDLVGSGPGKLFGDNTPVAQVEDWRRRVAFVRELLPEADAAIGYSVESLLYSVNLEHALEIGLTDLVMDCVQRWGAEVVRPMVFALCGRGRDSFAERQGLERYLCERIVREARADAAAALTEGLAHTVFLASHAVRELPADFQEFADRMAALHQARTRDADG